MDIIRELLARVRRLSIVVLVGLVVIGYLSLGFVYWQEINQQNTLTEDIAKQNQVLSKPLVSGDQLKADYAKVTDNHSFLASVPNDKAAFAKIVEIAAKNGIDTSETSGKLGIPGLSVSEVTLGGSKFQLLAFHGIRVQGDNASVLSFLSDLDSGKTMETVVLKHVSISYAEIPLTIEEAERRAEYKTVSDAVLRMMADNKLSKIPQPLKFAGGIAANVMGDDPATPGKVEGFPDTYTLAIDKGYTGSIYTSNVSPRDGYVLFQHDKINTDNTFNFTTVNYLPMLRTKYFYTVEEDGTIRQFNSPVVVDAIEYRSQTGKTIETMAVVDVEIYVNGFVKE